MMLFNCGVLFICFLGIIILQRTLSSRRYNACSLIAHLAAILLVFLVYLITWNHKDLVKWCIDAINSIFYYLHSGNSNQMMMFGYDFLIIIVYAVTYIIGSVIIHQIIENKEIIRKKTKRYFVIKYILVFINLSLDIVLFIFILATLNTLIKIPESFLSPLLNWIRKGFLGL